LLRALSDKSKLFRKDNLKAAFDFFDRNKNGEISWDEINTVIFRGRTVNDSLMNEYLGQIGKKR
jgi:Ca2+-binding EF-hand superfamily protein